MKTKVLLLIAFAAIITLSFSFAGANSSQNKSAKEGTVASQNSIEPLGGFISEDKF